MALGLSEVRDVYNVREDLEAIGVAGDPAVMGVYLKRKIGDAYQYHSHASIADMVKWLDDGELLITHGWFTRAGHVLAIDGHEGAYFGILDPWTEFDFHQWQYTGTSVGYQGLYSKRGIYSACVHGNSFSESRDFYRSGQRCPENEANAWVHRIKAH